jgi:hypothetical protein
MKNSLRIILWLALLALLAFDSQPRIANAGEATAPAGHARPGTALNPGGTDRAPAIPWDQIGAKAGADYHGDGLAVIPDGNDARLHCVFQRLEGEATREGLWLVSTATNPPGDRFRVVATAVGGQSLSPQGTVTVDGQTVRFTRAGLVEEYSVSMNGVRQDFVVTENPAGGGQLELRLAVTGARVESTASGAQLVLEQSGRKIAYSQLHATDATGKELLARIEVQEPSAFSGRQSPAFDLAVIVDNASAVYPVRIDPTFSDANWMSIGGLNDTVDALAVSGDTLYAGGSFTTAAGNPANYIAQWNGRSWSPLGFGMDGPVLALAVSGTNLYAGGVFRTATNSGNAAVGVNAIAQWNGNNWSALGSGMNHIVYSLAASGTNLYAGGQFTTAGGTNANCIAQWNGSSWSPLGSGINGPVYALAVLGTNLYAGGVFRTAGGNAAAYIAQWNGSSWSAAGSGTDAGVTALAVSGTNLYVGGGFTTATNSGGVAVNVNCIARWNGGSWSALGSGMGGSAYPNVYALAVSGGTLYAGGGFTTAGGKVSAYVADALLGWPLRQPQTGTVEVGTMVDFSVTCLPGDFTYELFFNGTNLLCCSTNGCLQLTDVSFSQSGAYTVVITNSWGAATSSPVLLSVVPAVECRPVPAFSLLGETGSVLNVQYANTLGSPTNWLSLGTVDLTVAQQLYLDASAPLPPQRFYRLWQTGKPAVSPSLNLPFMVPAITLTGNIGDQLQLDYINRFGPTNAWVTLGIVTLTNTSQLYFDLSAPSQPARLYRFGIRVNQ